MDQSGSHIIMNLDCVGLMILPNSYMIKVSSSFAHRSRKSSFKVNLENFQDGTWDLKLHLTLMKRLIKRQRMQFWLKLRIFRWQDHMLIRLQI